MSKPLPLDDFRAIRIMLEPDDFALSDGEDPPASDLIDEETWHGIVDLPGDVSLRTSNYHGSSLKLLYNLWAAWIETVGDVQDALYPAILDASDEFQAITFNAMNGYYRQAISCLRNALEQITIGTYFQISKKITDYEKWRAGELDCSFGQACDNLINSHVLRELNEHLKVRMGDSLFRHKSVSYPGGWARRLYSELSDFSHARPGFSSGDLWQSNGPIYVSEVFLHIFQMSLQVSALCFILVKLARPEFNLPQDTPDIFHSPEIGLVPIASTTYEFLFREHK